MAINFNTDLINSRLTQILNSIDAGTGPGTFTAYDGIRPSKGGAATNALFIGTFSDPSFPVPVAESITATIPITIGEPVVASLDVTLDDINADIEIDISSDVIVSLQASLRDIGLSAVINVATDVAPRYPCSNASLVFNRYDASYFNNQGLVVDPTPTSFSSNGSLQPFRGGEVQTILPEGVTSDSVKVYYTNVEIREASQRMGTRADDTLIRGERFEVFRVFDWTSTPPRRCDHYKVILIRQDINEDDN